MNVFVNGDNHEVTEGTTVYQLLVNFELTNERVAVERNGEIIKKNEYASTVLSDGDVLEVVRFVGGG